jgi:ubiquinone/menaquinone biosynthesis C-methylase UbiE
MNILDVCCGSKMFWFDKYDERVIFGDIRKENHILCDNRKLVISPDVLFDFTEIPFKDNQFSMVVFDPPHLIRVGKNSWMYKKYGELPTDWKDQLKAGFSECFRVLKCGGNLVFKWNEDQIKVSEILRLTDKKPLIGHKSGRNSKTHWISFYKE